MNRAMTKQLIQLPVTFSLPLTRVFNNHFSRRVSLVLLSALLTATGTQAIGVSSQPVSALAPPANTDTVRIDTVRSDAIDAGAGIAFYNEQAIILSNSKFQQKMIPGLISFGEDGTYLADPEALDRTPKKLLAWKDPFAHAPAGMATATGSSVLYYTAPENDSRGKDKIFAVPIESGSSGAKVTLAPVYADMLPFCEGSDAYRHPAVPENNAFMVFASDRKGSMGGFDLFLVQKEGNSWGRPIHLGNEINSVKDELYPFLDSENNLYFSSEGHSGFGGLDIYMCRYAGDGWERPINLMNVINGPGDEYGLKINARNSTGFFTSIDHRGNMSSQLFKLQPKQGELSEELLDMALTSFEEMFGVEFASSAEQKMTIPQAFEMKEIQTEKATVVEDDKAEKDIEEVLPTDPRPQEFVAARSTPDKPTVREEQKDTGKQAGTTTQEKTVAVMPEKTAEPKENATAETTERLRAAEVAGTTAQQAVEQVEEKDAVIFRVQITSTRSSVAGKKETIDGRSYTVFEYNYKGAYRQTVGAFRDLDKAKAFQTKCRNAGYSQAFVAAFINDERVTDPAVFRN